MLTSNDKIVLQELNRDGRVDRILEEIKNEIAINIISTAPDNSNSREDLYNMARSLDAVKRKLQECANFEEDKE